MGIFAFHYLTGAETDLAVTQFESIADRALTEAKSIALQKRWSTITMASIVSELCPNATAWPFVTVPGFERMVGNLLSTSSNINMAFAPMVLPEQLAEWEDFIYDFYENTRKPPFPNGTAVSPFGKGVWGTSNPFHLNSRFHDNGLSTTWGSPNQFLFPITHADEGKEVLLLFNMYGYQNLGRSIDDMVECSVERAADEGASGVLFDESDCGSMTEMESYFRGPTQGPRSTIMQPIYAANNPTTVRSSRYD